MSAFFLMIVNMSISAGFAVAAVFLLRLLLRKAPRWISVLLWGIAAVRLICPFTIESAVSLMPNAQVIDPGILAAQTPAVRTGFSSLDGTLSPVIDASFSPEAAESANPLQIWIPALALVWVIGIAALLLYAAVSCWRVKKQVAAAVLLRDNVFQSEHAASPFIFGIVRPKIYLPFHMDEKDMANVLAHEQAHIRRKDNMWKPLGFALVVLHWFNPLVWLAYLFFCRDIEFACDEKAVREFTPDQRADYSQALLSCSVRRRTVSACPLSFGEVGVKKRVIAVLRYKRPAFWVIAAAVTVSAVAALCLLTSPRTPLSSELQSFLDGQIAQRHRSDQSDGRFAAVNYEVLDVERSAAQTTVYMWVLYQEYSSFDGEIRAETGSHIPTVITAEQTGPHGHYQLVEYWEPRDGAYYEGDIREKFPPRLLGRAFDSQRYLTSQKAENQKAAEAYFAVRSNYEATPLDQVQNRYDSEEFVITAAHHQTENGLWAADGRFYTYRLEIGGAMPGAAKRTAYLVLSNTDDITFEQVWKASGFSSDMADYFDPADAKIVGHKIYSGS